MGLSFYNQRRAKEKEKQKLSASIDNAETLIDAKDDASLPHQEEEGFSLEPQPIEDIQITSEESEEPQESETEEYHEESEVEETKEETKVEETEQAQTPKEETKKVSDAQKIKNAKQKANKTK